jgi:hypothetical protein
MNTKYRLMALLLGLLLTNCSIIDKTRKSAGIERLQLFKSDKAFEPTLFWSHYDATQRAGLYLVVPQPDGTVQIRVISENPPDASISTTIENISKIKVKDAVEIGNSLSAITSVAELGNRNSSNYMIRDIAFRIESLKTGGLLDTDVIELYKLLLVTAEKISIAESQVKISENKLELVKEIKDLIQVAQDTTKKQLGLDSTFFDAIELLIK